MWWKHVMFRGIAGFVYRFDPPSRCNIVRLNSYRSFCFCLLDIFSSNDGRAKISKKRKPAAAGYSYNKNTYSPKKSWKILWPSPNKRENIMTKNWCPSSEGPSFSSQFLDIWTLHVACLGKLQANTQTVYMGSKNITYQSLSIRPCIWPTCQCSKTSTFKLVSLQVKQSKYWTLKLKD